MFRRISFIVSILISSSFVFSTGSDTSKIFIKEPGAKALEFGMSGLFHIQKGIGGNISYKSFQSSNSAKRFGVSINGKFGMDFNNWEYIYNSDSLNTEKSKTNKEYYITNSFVFIYQKIKYLEPKNDIALYYGYGPKVGYSFYNVLYERPFNIDDTEQRKQQRNRLYGGLSTVVGIEWFYHSNISLYAEYQNDVVLGLDYDIKHTELIRSSLDEWTTKDESIGPYLSFGYVVNSGVSFYFK